MDAMPDEPESPAGAPAMLAPQARPRLADDLGRWQRVVDSAEKHFDTEVKRCSKFVKDYRGSHYTDVRSGDENSEDNLTANFIFPGVNIAKALLVTNSPTFEIDPRDGSGASDKHFGPLVQMGLYPNTDAARRDFADALEDVLTHSYERCHSHDENEAALFDALTRGMGITKESFDVRRGLNRVDCIKRHELYIDPNARHTIRQAQWVCHLITKPIEEARDFFATLGVPPASIEPNYQLSDGKGYEADLTKRLSQAESGEKDQYRFYEIWLKDGDDRTCLYLAWSTKRLITRRPWPFRLEIDDFPFSILAFNKQYVQLKDAFSELEVVDGLRKSQERMIRFFDKTTNRSIAKKMLFDNKMSTEAIELLKNPDDFQFVPIDTKGRGLDGWFKLVEFNSKDEISVDKADKLKSYIDEITGQDEMLRGGSDGKDMTATESEIRDTNNQLRTGLRVKAYDNFMTNQASHGVQIIRQLGDPEKVRAIAGDKAAMLWQLHAADPEDFLCEYTVGVAAGSTGQRAKRERMDRFSRFRQSANEENQNAMQSGKPPIWDTDQIMVEMVREDNVRNPDRFRFPPAPPPQPMMAGPGGPPPMPGQAPAPQPGMSGPVAPGAGMPPPGPAPAPQLTPTMPNAPGVPQVPQMMQPAGVR